MQRQLEQLTRAIDELKDVRARPYEGPQLPLQ